MRDTLDPKQASARLLLWAWPRSRHLYAVTLAAEMESVIAAHTTA